MHQTPIEYTRTASRACEPLIRPSLFLSRSLRNIGIQKLIRQGFGRRILEKSLVANSLRPRSIASTKDASRSMHGDDIGRSILFRDDCTSHLSEAPHATGRLVNTHW
jgi:hypothetical protein